VYVAKYSEFIAQLWLDSLFLLPCILNHFVLELVLLQISGCCGKTIRNIQDELTTIISAAVSVPNVSFFIATNALRN